MEIISTPRDGKVKHARVFQISLKGKVRNLPSQWGRGKVGNFGEGEEFFIEW